MLLILPSKRFSIFLVNHLTPGREIEAPENRLKFQPAPLPVVDDQRKGGAEQPEDQAGGGECFSENVHDALRVLGAVKVSSSRYSEIVSSRIWLRCFVDGLR